MMVQRRYPELKRILRYYESVGYTLGKQMHLLDIGYDSLMRYRRQFGITGCSNRPRRNAAILAMDVLGFTPLEIADLTSISRVRVRSIITESNLCVSE